MDAARSVPYEREEGTYDTPSEANISILQYPGRQHILAFCTKCVVSMGLEQRYTNRFDSYARILNGRRFWLSQS